MNVGRFQLTYCTNVHPGETLDEIYRVLNGDVVAVRDALGVTFFGLGIRLGHSVISQLLRDTDHQKAFINICHSENYSVFTVNGFPYGNFDSGRVKENVYAPDWTHNERLQYTLDIARLMTRLPGPAGKKHQYSCRRFQNTTDCEDVREVMARNMVAAAEGLARIADETGIHIRLCLEPEPWTTLETTPDVLQFWERHFNPQTQDTQTHLGICYDVCHQAVHFEDPVQSISALADANIHIGKIQISSALGIGRTIFSHRSAEIIHLR